MNVQFGSNFGGGFSSTSFGGGFMNEIALMLDQLGILDIILPFILIFTVLFAILQKVGIFVKGKERKAPGDPAERAATKINAIVSLAVSLMVVLPHAIGGIYPPGMNVVIMINQGLQEFSVAAIAVIMMLMLVGIGSKSIPNNVSKVISLAAVGAVLYILYRAINYNSLPDVFGQLGNNRFLIMFVVMVLVIGLIIRGLMAPPAGSGSSGSGLGNFLKAVYGSSKPKQAPPEGS